MKKIVLILITLILAAGMVFAAGPVSTQVKISGNVTPYTPPADGEGVVSYNGLSIVWYVVENKDSDTPSQPVLFDTSGKISGTKDAISVDVLQATSDGTQTKSLSLVFGAVCDVPPTINSQSISISVTNGGWKLDESDDTVNTLELNTVTKSLLSDEGKTYPESSTGSDSKLTCVDTDNSDTNTKITVTATAGTNNNRETELIGWTSVTWGPSDDASAVTAGNYNATITVAITAT